MTTEQPPKQAPYYQSENAITHNPFEQTRQRGDSVPNPSTSTTHRTANSNPSSDKSLARLKADYQRGQARKQGAPDVDLEYGVEQQPAEGDIANAVEHKGTRTRTQAGAHSGPVGSAFGPGYSGFGEDGDAGQDQTKDLGRKREEHDRVLGDRVGQSPPEPVEDSEDIREQKLKLDERLNVKDAVKEATGDPVVGR